MNPDDPIVDEVVRCEDLPPGSLAGRRMIVRWSDGTEGEAVRFYQDEVLFSEGDHGSSGCHGRIRPGSRSAFHRPARAPEGGGRPGHSPSRNPRVASGGR